MLTHIASRLRCKVYLVHVLNFSFAALTLTTGLLGNYVTLPLWTGVTTALENPNCTMIHNSTARQNRNETNGHSLSPATMDPFFVISFSLLSFTVILGIIICLLLAAQLLINAVAGRQVLKMITKENDLLFPQWLLIVIGVLNAFTDLLSVFSSLPSRIAPFLQAILPPSIIPLTIFFRYSIYLQCSKDILTSLQG